MSRKLILPTLSRPAMDDWHRTRWSALKMATAWAGGPYIPSDVEAWAVQKGFADELQVMRSIRADSSSGPNFFKYLEDWFFHDNSSLTDRIQERGREIPDNLQEIWDVWPEHADQMIAFTSSLTSDSNLLAWVLQLPTRDRPKRIEESKYILAHMKRRATAAARKIMEYSVRTT
jgi:hypothetical protein